MDDWDIRGGIRLDPDDVFRPNLAATIDDTRTWVDPRGYRLSDRLWRARADDRKQIDTVLRAGLARGASPLETARAVEHLLNPEYQPRRDPETFRIKPASQQPKGVVTTTPRQGPGTGPFRPRNSGLGSYAARRLARTETTRAFGAAALRAAKANPLLERFKWLLSGSHHEPDACDQNAERSSRDQPRGVYFSNEIPMYPNHPHEMCTIAPYVTQQDIEAAIPRLQEFIRTGELPPRDWVPGQSVTPATLSKLAQDIAPLRQAFEGISSYADSARAEELVRKAGKLVRRDVLRAMSPADRKRFGDYAKQQKAVSAAEDKSNKLFRKMDKKTNITMDDFIATDTARREMVEARRKLDAMRAETFKPSTTAPSGNPFKDAMQATFDKFRPMGSDQLHPYTPFSDALAKKAVDGVRHVVPREWWDDSISFGMLHTEQVGRGYYQPTSMNPALRAQATELMLSPRDLSAVAKHEFGHRVENVRPRVRVAEDGFYRRRTAGEDLEHMGNGYPPDEVTRPDKFGSRYIGKEYSDNYHEILSMGLEDLMRVDGKVPELLLNDDDMMDFIVGLMAIG